MMKRRQFLLGLMAAGVVSPLLSSRRQPREFWVSASGDKEHRFSLTATGENQNLQSALTGFRGHGLAQHPQRKASVLMFSRRPGTQCVEINLASNQVTHRFEAGKNRVFCGHGCFSGNGQRLFTTEIHPRSGQGFIGIRDTNHYQSLGEIESHGIGPHEIKMLPGSNTLIIANGGIHTEINSARKMLNLDQMRSNLSFVDSLSGELLNAFQVPESKASIRHIDVAADGKIALAMQVQREATGHQKIVPLAGMLDAKHTSIQLLNKPVELIAHLQDYLGSVVINPLSKIAGFTSPKGNLAAFWSIETGEFIAYHRFNDVCGISLSADASAFVLSNSFGEIRHIDALNLQEQRDKRQQFKGLRWDNHLITVQI